MKIYPPIRNITLFFICLFAISSCQDAESKKDTQSNTCINVTDIEGEYSCQGECIVTASDGQKTLVKVTGETDRIISLQEKAGSNNGLYEVYITGKDNFKELEIGALTERTLRTATADVSDGQYPVLEEYVFETDPFCKAIAYTKIVRNPTQKNFKTCAIFCRKVN